MDGLQERYGDQIDFIHLDIEQDITEAVRYRFDVPGHTQYALIDAEGNVIHRWFGYLNESEMLAFFAEFTASLSA